MNYLSDKFESIEQGIEKLKEAVSIRDQMGGAMYYNILNDDCCEMAITLASMGANREELSKILGKGTHH
jgi:hypothetical protein